MLITIILYAFVFNAGYIFKETVSAAKEVKRDEYFIFLLFAFMYSNSWVFIKIYQKIEEKDLLNFSNIVEQIKTYLKQETKKE